ncbi:MAG TPA: ankyrin repeat domain-containing protein [Candidatus Acidoferrales bacterium]|nr:ankyrin repeat domain-containing protein [Candidatus Acidoferrales bacterium]
MGRIGMLVFVSAWTAFAGDANEDLLAASRAGDLAGVKTAIEHGAALETKTPYGQTALYLAAMNGNEDVVRYLLDKGANTNIRDTFYKAPMLGFVVMRKHWEVAKLLASKSTSVDQDLGAVADTGRADLVQAVLSAGKPSQASLDKAYESALERKQTEVAGVLKQAGAHEPAPPVVVEAAVLESYAGTYKSEQLPVEVKVFARDGKLYIQAVGQPELATKALSPTRFAYAPAQIEVEFDAADSFTLKQGGGSFKFKKGAAK